MRIGIKEIYKIVSYSFAILLAIVGVLVLYFSLPYFGHKALIVRSGSMAKALPVGSVLIIQTNPQLSSSHPFDNIFKVGDIVTYEKGNQLITHRIVSIQVNNNKIEYTFKGDANDSPDQNVGGLDSIVGSKLFFVPHLGGILNSLQDKTNFYWLIIFPTIAVIFCECINIFKEIRKSRLRRHHRFALFLLPFLMLPLTLNQTFAQFTDSASVLGNVFSAATTFPTGSVTATPTPVSGDHLVINEVYYIVDVTHGGSNGNHQNNQGEIEGENNNTGEGSNNEVDIDLSSNCNSEQTSYSDVDNKIKVDNSTGSNEASGNTGDGGVTAGDSSSNVDIVNSGNTNSGGCGNGGSNSGQRLEWVELYNPTDEDINLKNWSLTDDTVKVTIHSNRIIKARGFALISRSNATWSFWDTHSALLVPLGRAIGNGLGDSGDRLVLKNNSNGEIDKLSWGTDTSVFTIANVAAGQSLNRVPTGLDTNSARDFSSSLPSPGL